MSAFITPIAPISLEIAVEPQYGTTTEVISGESIVVTDPIETFSRPVEINYLSGEVGDINFFKIASGIEGADIIIDGDGDGAIAIGNAIDANGNTLAASGSTFQVAEDYQGTVIANLDGAITDGTKVDLNTETTSGNTIADALGGLIGITVPPVSFTRDDFELSPVDLRPEEFVGFEPFFDANSDRTGLDLVEPLSRSDLGFDYYVNTGAANDQVGGSQGNDFIRLGAGDDTFNAESGDDIVRMGSGDDFGSLGDGDDIAYFTIDQLQGEQTKVITDFDSAGDDKIQINGDLAGLIDIDGIGTNSLVIELSGAQSGTTTITSEAESFDEDDIEFVFFSISPGLEI